MPVSGPSVPAWSRRSLIGLAAAAVARAAQQQAPSAGPDVYPSEAKRYFDPATEFPVIRLTEPAFSSYLSAPWNRAITRRGILLYASDRGGTLGVFRMDIKGGQSFRLADAPNLDPQSIALLPNDRSFCFIDGTAVRLAQLASRKDRAVYNVEPPYERLTALALEPEGQNAYVVEQNPQRSRLRLVSLSRGSASTLIETPADISMPVPRPGGGLAYRSAGELFVWNRPGTTRQLPLPAGRAMSAYWSPDGAALIYLNVPDKPRELNSLRIHVVAGGEDKEIAKTTQFIQFMPNADQSVFAGASGSKASPHVLILVRSVRRELTICEHRARDPKNLAIAFAPDSQRLVFQSDQHGKPALFMVVVERFVEETQSE